MSARGKRILVVDDEEDIREELRRVLEYEGYVIRLAASGADALASLEGVVEGAATTESVVELSAQVGVEMPITQAVHDILFGQVAPPDAIAQLMQRPLKAES